MAEERNDNIQQNIILNYKTNANSVSGDVNKLGNSVEKVTDSQQENTKETKANENAYKSFKTQIREAQQELLKLSQTYGEASKEAVEAAKRVADLRDQMGMASQLVEGFNPDRKFQAFSTAANIAATAASGVTSGMALFGATSEDTQEALLKVQAAMAFSDSINNITELADSFATLKAQGVAMFTSLATAKTADTVATQANAGAQIEGAVADGVRTGALTLSTVATTAATIATNLFTASIAILAAPITLLILAITGLIALIGYLAGAWGDFSGEAARAEAANKKLSKEIDNMAESTKKSNEAMEIHNDYLVAMAKASGKSSEEIRKLKEELINQEVAEKRLNAVKALSIALEAQRIGMSEDATESQKETQKKAVELFKSQNKTYEDSLKEREQMARDHRIEIVAEETQRNKELLEKQQEHNKKMAEEARKRFEDEKKRLEELAKLKKDLETKALQELQDLNDKSEEEKLARQKERALAEIEALRQKGVDVSNLMIYNEEKFFLLDQELKEKRRLEQEEKDKEEEAIWLERDKKFKEDQLAAEQAVADQKAEINDKLKSLTEQGFATAKMLFEKNKGVQKGIIIAENAVGLASVAINTAKGISTAMAKGAAGIPEAVIVGASGVLSAVNIVAATTKALSALGGGSASGGGSGSSQQTPSGGNSPQVGFQNSSENQISTAVGKAQEEREPIKAFVVSSEVTTAQSLDRNRVESNSF
jgi:hypothetical protein